MLDSRDIIKYSLVKISARLMAVALCLSLLFVNIPVSFADFASNGKQTFTASVTIPALVDADHDGISDAWEAQYGLDPTDPDDANNDEDSDGITNLEESHLGTSPLVSNSGINVRIVASPNSGAQPLDVTLTAEVADDGGYDIVKYEWDFDGSGTYDYSLSDNTPFTYKYTASGTHNIKLRVTNSAGGVGVTTATINVTKIGSSPDAITNPAIPIQPLIPSNWVFSGTETDDITVYQWDLTGNGEYDFTSTRSPSITYTYKDVGPGSFNTHFRVTDAEGLSDIGAVGVEINSSSWYSPGTAQGRSRPKIIFPGGYVIREAEAGEEISLSGYGIPVAGNDFGYAKKLEWDFEGDGIYDWVTSLLDDNTWTDNTGGKADVTHIYGRPGIYRATLRATTNADVTATDHILVIVEDDDLDAPEAEAEAEYYIDNEKHEYEEGDPAIEGTIPFRATFIHKESSSDVTRFEWDFDGNKRFDWTGTERNPTENKPVYTYTTPGYYLASLRVTNENGLTDTDYIPVFVTMPDTYASMITTPEEGQTIAGNAITLTSDVFPDDDGVSTVMFQYSADSGATWNDIGQGQPIASYTATWDTTTVSNGDYLIRAIVNGVNSEDFRSLSGVVDNNFDPDNIPDNIDIYENSSNGTYTKITKLDPDKDNEIVLSNGTRIKIPIGALKNNGDEPRLTIVETDESAGVGNAIDLTIEGADNFEKDITIIVPYPDADNDGIVDGTGRSENDIVIMWKNEKGEWEPLSDSVVYPDENFIVAKINHLSLFGAGFMSGVAAALGGGSTAIEGALSYCFIATAVYGSADAGDVMILRKFRDRFLLTGPLGKRFVNYYYQYSPSIAEYIKDKPALKRITRLVLKPIVKFAEWKLSRSE